MIISSVRALGYSVAITKNNCSMERARPKYGKFLKNLVSLILEIKKINNVTPIITSKIPFIMAA